MNVLVLGGTGSIGVAVVRALLTAGHSVTALARSAAAYGKLAAMGATPLSGDLREPAQWVEAVHAVDGIIHVAAAWGRDMAAIDQRVVTSILAQASLANSPKPFIYTGGCWLYGETGDAIASEESGLNSLPAFEWSVAVLQQVLSSPQVRGMVIHPAMVYERDGGVCEYFADDARQLGVIRVVGSANVRWPMVHCDDLAQLYLLMLQHGDRGDVYNGAAIAGVRVGELAQTIARRLGASPELQVLGPDAAQQVFGELAAGFALDQQMSGEKAMRCLHWQPAHADVLADLA